MLPFFEKKLKKWLLSDFPHQSRVHSLESFNTFQLQCYLKRDDELGTMGSKMRKFCSIIPNLLKHQTEEVVVIGGAHSNHVLGISQLLIENGIKPHLFLRETKQESLKGNALLIKLLIPDEQIHCVKHQEWKDVDSAAKNFTNKKSGKKRVFVIPEEGFMPEAFPGALTLPYDILCNEKTFDLSFQHFFIDSGTGMMAIALILGLAFLQHPGHVHVVLIAGDHNEFIEKLKIYHAHFCSFMGRRCPWPTQFSTSKPQQAKAFGSTNAGVFKAIREIARIEGVLCDPIYNAKLFIEAKRKILNEDLEGKALIIHSGGVLSLPGFL